MFRVLFFFVLRVLESVMLAFVLRRCLFGTLKTFPLTLSKP